MNTRREFGAWQTVIRDLVTDAEGNLLTGQAHQITPDQVLAKMGLRRRAEDMTELAWFKAYGQAQGEMNYFYNKLTRNGFNGKAVIAGGINRAPTFYIIASNRYEERLITGKKIRRVVGGLRQLSATGRNVLPNVRRVEQLAGDLDRAADEMEKRAPLQIAE